ncbi:NAD(P)/FAD-dependent oxidoreductase [Piscibacillus halophilus]|uniref:NAD(P)/FAD-dependent oxidoreductase n=1 Tax=Piscibacillus halophilus TaxID=571933 RepID=UPI00158AA037|nr:FAD-binding oxidoreductase [Piscibacillus halophilus]
MKPFVIIGAGILGASTAYHLAKKGASVLVIDKKDQGEATRSAAGIISPWLSQKKNETLYNIVKNGANYYPKLIHELSDIGINNTSYAQVGSLHLHKSDDKLDKMIADVGERRLGSPEINEIYKLSGREVEQSVSIMSDRMGAIKISGGARINGDLMRQGLIEGATQYGAEVIQGEAEFMDEKTIKVNGAQVEAEKVIVTSGAWAGKLLKQVGITLNVTSQKTQILHLEMPNNDPSKWPAIMLPNNKYIVGFEEHKVFVGSTHQENYDFDSTSSANGVFEILKSAFKFAPGLKEAKFIESRVGFRPMLPEKAPFIGTLPGSERILVANGLGASGITSGPYLGKEIANMISV